MIMLSGKCLTGFTGRAGRRKTTNAAEVSKGGEIHLKAVVAAIALLFCKFGVAMGLSNSQLLQKHAEEVQMVNTYLRRANTVVADFTQTSKYSSVSKGKIYMDRYRQYLVIDYQTGDVPITVYSLKGRNSYLDKETREILHIPSKNLVAKALLANSISDGQFLFESIKRKDGNIELVFRFAQNPSEGRITIHFDAEKNRLSSVGVLSQDGEAVKIEIGAYQENVEISKEFFEVPLVFDTKEGTRRLNTGNNKALEQMGSSGNISEKNPETATTADIIATNKEVK